MSRTRRQAEGLTLLRSERGSSGFTGVRVNKPGKWAKGPAKLRGPTFTAAFSGAHTRTTALEAALDYARHLQQQEQEQQQAPVEVVGEGDLEGGEEPLLPEGVEVGGFCLATAPDAWRRRYKAVLLSVRSARCYSGLPLHVRFVGSEAGEPLNRLTAPRRAQRGVCVACHVLSSALCRCRPQLSRGLSFP